MARGIAKNRFVGVNYLNDNPRMATPPEFFLQRLFDFDAELVMFPSRHVPYAYVLARRQRMVIPSENRILIDTIDQPDTKLCLSYGLVPVTMIYRYYQGAWDIDAIIRSLKARDTWAHGGGEKYADKLDAQDAEDERKRKAQLRDDMWMRSGQAWESYKRRTGQRTSVPGRATVAPVSTKPPSGSTGHGLITLTDA